MLSPLIVPLSAGGELRLVVEGEKVDLQCWRVYEGGMGMMAGGIRLGTADLRLALHSLRTALWAMERTEGGFPALGVSTGSVNLPILDAA